MMKRSPWAFRAPQGKSVFLLVLTLLTAFLLAYPLPSRAAESSWSHYYQGTYGEFGLGMTPSAGFTFRNDLIFNNSVASQTLIGGRGYAKASQNSVTDLMKGFYFFDVPKISGRLGFGVLVPGVFNAEVNGRVNQGKLNAEGYAKTNGFGDIAVLPVIVNVNQGNFHFTFTPALFLPTGYYNSNRIISLGRKYYSVDFNLGFTWLDPKIGLEASYNMGYMINTKNNATQYRTGDEFHLDFLVAQHLSPRFGFGLNGYVYSQASGDSGSGAVFGPYRSSAIGYGPAVIYTPKIFGKDFNLIGKWLHDTTTTNRFKGETIFLSVAFSL